jgi:molybdopterin-synthase adenylyltransferase
LLARSGVGMLRIVDRDYVEPSNLQRQTLFDENDARDSVPKAIAAARQIARFNSQIVVEPHVADLIPANVDSLLGGCDLILDGTDNFETRYLINDYAVKNSVPWIYAAAVGSYALTMNVLPGETACLSCIFPQSPRGTVETCETAGILYSAVNLVASIAATEALKFLVGAHSKMRRTLLSWDVWTNERAELAADSAQRRRDAATCSGRLCSSGRRRASAHYFVWQEFGADSRAAAAGGLCRDERAVAASWQRAAQRVCAEVLARTV